MPSIKHIAFPVDFSVRSNGAVPYVAEMARRHDARLTFLAVAHPHYTSGLEVAPMIDPQLILDGVQSQLDRMISALSIELAGVTVNRFTVLGDPAQAISNFIAANKVDLVLMPTHGYGPFRQLLLGSVTAKVLHDVHIPVWTTAHTSEAPDRAHVFVSEILCAVDTSSASIELMRWAAGLCKSLGATLRLVHAVPAIAWWPELQMDQGFEQKLHENAMRTIQNLERAADISVPVCVGAGTVPDVVREAALEHDADLIVIGRGALQETMGRLRTHSYGIIRYAPCPVISV